MQAHSSIWLARGRRVAASAARRRRRPPRRPTPPSGRSRARRPMSTRAARRTARASNFAELRGRALARGQPDRPGQLRDLLPAGPLLERRREEQRRGRQLRRRRDVDAGRPCRRTPAARDGGEFERASDPWISFSPNGVLHSMSLVTDPDPPSGGFGDNGMVANRSFDGGLTWEASKQLITDTNPRFLNDKNSMTADPNDSDFVYAVWDRLQQAGGDVNNPENRRGLGLQGADLLHPLDEQRGDVRAGAEDLRDGAQQADDRQPDRRRARERGRLAVRLLRRHDELVEPAGTESGRSTWRTSARTTTDRTWTKPKRGRRHAADGAVPLQQRDRPGGRRRHPCPEPDPEGNCPVRAGDLLPEVAVNRVNGNLYARLAWTCASTASAHDQIAFTQSTDGGNSWSAPIKVNLTPPNADPDNEQAFTPSVHVADDGTVAVSYFDFRNNAHERRRRHDRPLGGALPRRRARTARTRRAGTRRRGRRRCRSTCARRRSHAAGSSATTWAWRHGTTRRRRRRVRVDVRRGRRARPVEHLHEPAGALATCRARRCSEH